MVEPSEEAAAKAQKKAGERAVSEYTSGRVAKEKLESGGGVLEQPGPGAPRLEEADASANRKVKTDWQIQLARCPTRTVESVTSIQRGMAK